MWNAGNAIRRAPRRVGEVEISLRYAGVRRGIHLAHDGWAETENMPWEGLGKTRAVANRRAGDVSEYND